MWSARLHECRHSVGRKLLVAIINFKLKNMTCMFICFEIWCVFASQGYYSSFTNAICRVFWIIEVLLLRFPQPVRQVWFNWFRWDLSVHFSCYYWVFTVIWAWIYVFEHVYHKYTWWRQYPSVDFCCHHCIGCSLLLTSSINTLDSIPEAFLQPKPRQGITTLYWRIRISMNIINFRFSPTFLFPLFWFITIFVLTVHRILWQKI